MSRPARASLPLPLALLSGLCLGLSALGTPAPAAPTTSGTATLGAPDPAGVAGEGSTSPHLGEALGPSTPEQINLANYLRSKGVIFYGAYWCPHCFHQKAVFGQQAGNRLPYVECAKDLAGARACDAAGVTAYPTWVMGKERRVGFQSLQELATWTAYPGPAPQAQISGQTTPQPASQP